MGLTIVPEGEIESIVGVSRDQRKHFARVDSSSENVYILHSRDCLESHFSLLDCPYSVALDKWGISLSIWEDYMDKPVDVALLDSRVLVPWDWDKKIELSTKLATDHLKKMHRLREERIKKGLTQEDVASMLGEDVDTIREMESYDGDPTVRLVRRYAVALDVDLTE